MPNPTRAYIEAWLDHQRAKADLVAATQREDQARMTMQEVWRQLNLGRPPGIYTWRGRAIVVGRGDYPDVFTLLEDREEPLA